MLRQLAFLTSLQIGGFGGIKVDRAELEVMHAEPVDDHSGELSQRQHRSRQGEIMAARGAEVIVETPCGNGKFVPAWQRCYASSPFAMAQAD